MDQRLESYARDLIERYNRKMKSDPEDRAQEESRRKEYQEKFKNLVESIIKPQFQAAVQMIRTMDHAADWRELSVARRQRERCPAIWLHIDPRTSQSARGRKADLTFVAHYWNNQIAVYDKAPEAISASRPAPLNAFDIDMMREEAGQEVVNLHIRQVLDLAFNI